MLKKQEGKHTETPWRVTLNQANWLSEVTTDTKIICSCDGYIGEAEANADFIVRAVNCHEELLTALRAAVYQMGRSETMGDSDFHAIVQECKTAISHAESKNA